MAPVDFSFEVRQTWGLEFTSLNLFFQLKTSRFIINLLIFNKKIKVRILYIVVYHLLIDLLLCRDQYIRNLRIAKTDVGSISNQQVVMRPQDLVVLMKLAVRQDGPFTYTALGRELCMSASEIHGSLGRARLARLVANTEGEGARVARNFLREFILHGARFAFPPVSGSLTRGIPTAYAGPVLREQLTMPDEPPPVWPHSKGSVRGVALYPLYPSVPRAAEKDPRLYEALSLFDAIRIGAAREREIASAALTKILA